MICITSDEWFYSKILINLSFNKDGNDLVTQIFLVGKGHGKRKDELALFCVLLTAGLKTALLHKYYIKSMIGQLLANFKA